MCCGEGSSKEYWPQLCQDTVTGSLLTLAGNVLPRSSCNSSLFSKAVHVKKANFHLGSCLIRPSLLFYCKLQPCQEFLKHPYSNCLYHSVIKIWEIRVLYVYGAQRAKIYSQAGPVQWGNSWAGLRALPPLVRFLRMNLFSRASTTPVSSPQTPPQLLVGNFWRNTLHLIVLA